MSASRRLIVSFHDLHPGSQEVCARFLQRLRELGVGRATLLVVPRWHGGIACTDDPRFVGWLRERAEEGHEICLHGFFHRVETVTGNAAQRAVGRHYTAGEGEFYQIDHATAAQRIRDGLAMLTAAMQLSVWGFTPPAWLLSTAGRDALRAAGLHYTTTWGTVEVLQRSEIVAAPTLVWSTRAAWRRICSNAWVRFWGWRHQNAETLRIAAHPADFAHPAVERSLYAAVKRHATGRTAARYRDLLSASDAPVSLSNSAT